VLHPKNPFKKDYSGMAQLEQRTLGRTGMTPRSLGLGCASMQTEEDAVDAIHCAIDLGINFVDTAPYYGNSERCIGIGLEGGWRDKVYLETKTGLYGNGVSDYTASRTRSSVENSLRLLKTDYFDAVLIHEPPEFEAAFAPGAALDELILMKDQGLLKHIGVGLRSHDHHRRAIETGHIDIILTYLDYTLVNQSVASTTLPLARENDIGIILASILGMGQLTGLRPSVEVGEARQEGGGVLALAMWEWCRDRDVNIRHLAMQFGLAAPVDGIVMTGPANRQQLEEAFEAATVSIDPQIWKDFEAEFGVRA